MGMKLILPVVVASAVVMVSAKTIELKPFPDYELRYTKISNINIDGLDVRKAEVAFQLDGDWHCRPKGLHFSNISVGAVLEQFTDVKNCEDVTFDNVKLREDDGTQKFCLNRLLPIKGKVGELTEGHRRAAAFFLRPDYTDGTLADGVYDLGAVRLRRSKRWC